MKKIWAYHTVVFLSAFLLFQIQPMVSKAVLPQFGGSYLVWGACMVFCQAMLLVGYAYAHAVQRKLGVARYGRLHVGVLLLPLLCFPFRFERIGQWASGLPLVLSVFTLLLVMIGLPFLVLSTTSLLLQRWLSVSDLPQKENPYVLYGASNLGSMLALLTYPTLVEPFLSLKTQGTVWWIGYAVMVLLHLLCLPRTPSSVPEQLSNPTTEQPYSRPRPRPRQLAGWLLLSIAACAMLLAVTNVMTFDVASVPFLWVLPLSVYLLSFVLTFKQRPWCPPIMRRLLPWAVLIGVLLHVMAQFRLTVPPIILVALHLLVCFVVCLNCSARLIESRPQTHELLTTFYICLAFGGLVGSVLVSWLVPLVSSSLIEYPLAFFLVALGLFCVDGSRGRAGKPWSLWVCGLLGALGVTLMPWLGGHVLQVSPELGMAMTALPVALVLLWASSKPGHWMAALLAITVSMNWTEDLAAGAEGVKKHRNYYGIYKVYDKEGIRYLQHGTTQHGRQYIAGPKAEIPLAYFHPTTPAGQLLTQLRPTLKRIGMIGLGTGALATYAGEGQSFTVYELDPDNLGIATSSFSYLDKARAQGAELAFVFGDGRVNLREVPDGALDLFILDAFNSGSIPVHLITVQAFEEYLRVVKPGGLVLMHISNKVLDLSPVVYSNAHAIGVPLCEKNNEGGAHPDAELTYWVAYSRDAGVVNRLCGEMGWWQRRWGADSLPPPWTDQYSNVFGAMLKK